VTYPHGPCAHTDVMCRTRSQLSTNTTGPSSSRNVSATSSFTSSTRNTTCRGGTRTGPRRESSIQRCSPTTGGVCWMTWRACLSGTSEAREGASSSVEVLSRSSGVKLLRRGRFTSWQARRAWSRSRRPPATWTVGYFRRRRVRSGSPGWPEMAQRRPMTVNGEPSEARGRPWPIVTCSSLVAAVWEVACINKGTWQVGVDCMCRDTPFSASWHFFWRSLVFFC
jgi:hypothetical protein